VQSVGGRRVGARGGFQARTGGMTEGRQGWDGVGGALGLRGGLEGGKGVDFEMGESGRQGGRG
jgi:hypothetical protein